ncbi:hypothetical protein A2714_01600 [Candidatus Woesebacteria bacterium RIFCSPHIGHO2_01_FULL_38_9]|uniref:Uncharacterized protein n=2 Tax=Candidatus Woeseibacteriota TaxID=1752722 RepID=A0A1F7Y160_9BACT|nr:MAG: hypothetical protein A2714_01600 [Candidatus Woesebacteria bacterium RIFCSPHIGHO2_01_FULL_38_9]OGM58786.1 MAG: hypothetical protein A3A75_00675 [Candidatus Woesebacteria bacterium RIFCSPLOWO2_01_FULL_39_10]
MYLELKYSGPVDSWVKKHIIPTFKNPKVSRSKAVQLIKQFIGKDKPYLVSYVNQYDFIYLQKLFESQKIKNKPFFWMPIDFASILFGIGINPEAYFPKDKENFFKEIGIDTSKFKHTHYALDDARLLREVYLRMTKGTSKITKNL